MHSTTLRRTNETMALKDNPIGIGFAIAITACAIVAFGNPNEIANSITQHSGKMIWLFPTLMGGAYLVSERQVGRMSNIELATIGIPIFAMVGMNQVGAINDIIVNNEPISQVALIGLSAGSVYVLMET